MGWLSALKTFIEAKLNITIGDISLVKVNVVRGKESQAVTYHKNEDTYTIDVEKLSTDDYNLIKSQYKEYVAEDKLLLETKSASLLEELYLFKNSSNSTLEFFHGIIPAADFSALRASIFVRDKFKASQPI